MSAPNDVGQGFTAVGIALRALRVVQFAARTRFEVTPELLELYREREEAGWKRYLEIPELRARVEAMAKDKGCHTAQLALAWLWKQGEALGEKKKIEKQASVVSEVDKDRLTRKRKED